MDTLTKIVTHPGGAHRDDFLACAVLLAKSPVTIERRDPTAQDLEDPKIAVLDIGHQHDPEKHNFDHHQFPRDHTPTCALSLVLQHLEIYEDAQNFCKWLEVTEWFDCCGPKRTGEWLGVDRDTLARTSSPIDVALLRHFAAATAHRPGEPVWEIMRMIGSDLIDYVTTLRDRLAFIAQTSEIWKINGDCSALFMPRTEPLPEEPSSGLERYIELNNLQDKVIATIYPDRRSNGYGLRRINDDPRLDFNRVDDQEDVHFTHKQGFIAKTSATENERLLALVRHAFS